MSEARYKCQYQKGSDKCKYAACRHPIPEGTLKIAKIATTKTSPTNWFHIECLFRSFKKSKEGGIKDAEKQIKGFKQIRQRDKDLINSYLTDSPDKSSSSSSSDSSSGSTDSSSATAEYKNKKKSNKSSSSSSDTSSSTSTSEDTKKKRRRSKSPTKSSSAKSSPSKKSPKKSPKKTPTKKKEKFVPPPTPDGPRTFKCPVPACPLDGFEGRGPTQNAQQNDLKRHLNKHINGKLKGRPTPSQLSAVRLRKCNGCRLCVALRKEYCLSCKKNASSEEDEKPKKPKAKAKAKVKRQLYPDPPTVTLKRKRTDEGDDEPGNGASKKKREDLKAGDTPAEAEKPEKDEASSEHSDN